MPHMRWDAVRVQGAVPTIKNHTATPLSRTELLIFGGYDGRCNHNALYLFNSATSTWTPLKAPIVRGTPPAGRNGHTATLAERKLFIVGGWLGSGPLAADDMHVLTLEDQHMVWSKPRVVGKAPGPCNMHTADYIAHLRSILVFRGGDGREYLNDLHALHIDTMEWGRVVASGRLPVPRANHSSTVVHGDQIVVFGGWDGQRRLNDIHVLDTRRMVWSSVEIHSALPHPRAGMTFTRHRDRVFLFGGSGPSAKCYNDLHIYDPHETRWVDVTALPDEQQLGSMAAAILEEDEEDDDDDDEEEEEEEEEDDHRDETEHEGGSHHHHHHHHHHERHRSTRGYSVGNTEYSGDGGLFNAYAYEDEDIASYANPNDIHTHHHRDQVVVVGMGPGQRAGHTCSVLEDRKLFVFGGSCGNDYLNDFYVLDTDPAPRAMISSTASPLHVLQKSLRHFVNSDEFSDISFLVEGRVVYAHKIILSLLSERFRGMFSGGFRESHEKQIVVPEIRYVVFVRMLEYLYSGECLEYEDDDDDRMAGAASADTSECEFVFHEDKTRRFSNGNDAARSSQFMAYDHHEQDGDGDRRRRATIGCFGGLTPMTRASSFYPRPMGVTASSSFDLDVLLELLVVADQFMLDHLKQYCERVLQHAVHVDSVGDILAAANESNAVQLKAICMHFLRNHEIQWVEQGHGDEDDNCFDDHDHDNCFDDHDDEEEAEADGVLDEEPIDCSRRLTGPCDL